MSLKTRFGWVCHLFFGNLFLFECFPQHQGNSANQSSELQKKNPVARTHALGLTMPSFRGQLQRWAKKILELRATDLATSLPQDLEDRERNLILHDFATANAVILLQLQVKLSYWEQLPYVCFVLAHPDPSESRLGMQKALHLYQNAPQVHHPLCRALFITHRAQLEEFLSGRPLEECQDLHLQAARMRFVSIVERKVEGLHAQVHMHLKHHVSLVHINFHAMLPRLNALLASSPRALQDISQHFADARDLLPTLKRLGLDQHPGVLELQNVWRHSQRSRTEAMLKSNGVLPIIFHVDGPTLFQDLSSFRSLLKSGHGLYDNSEGSELKELPPREPVFQVVGDMPAWEALMCKYAPEYAVFVMTQAAQDVIFLLDQHCLATPTRWLYRRGCSSECQTPGNLLAFQSKFSFSYSPSSLCLGVKGVHTRVVCA